MGVADVDGEQHAGRSPHAGRMRCRGRCRRFRVRQGADGEVVDPGLGDLAGIVQAQPAARLDLRPAGHRLHRAAHAGDRHVVEQHEVPRRRRRPRGPPRRGRPRPRPAPRGNAPRTARNAAATPPAATTWLSLTIAASDSDIRWLTPPPHRTAYFSSARSPGVVLRVSRTAAPVPCSGVSPGTGGSARPRTSGRASSARCARR